MISVLLWYSDQELQGPRHRGGVQREEHPGSEADLPRALWSTAFRKLDQIDSATDISDLRLPPGNRLEALKGDRKGQHSIRINDQYRICFRWTEGGADGVEIVDYHR